MTTPTNEAAANIARMGLIGAVTTKVFPMILSP
jgi:hypothetical protein